MESYTEKKKTNVKSCEDQSGHRRYVKLIWKPRRDREQNVPQIHGNINNKIWKLKKGTLYLSVWNAIQRSRTSIRDFPLQERFSTFPFYQDIHKCYFQSKGRLEDDSDEKCPVDVKCSIRKQKSWSAGFLLDQKSSKDCTRQLALVAEIVPEPYRESSATLPPLTQQISLSEKSGHRCRVTAKKGNGKNQAINFIYILSLK